MRWSVGWILSWGAAVFAVLLSLGVATSFGGSASAQTPLLLHVRVPSSVGFTFARFELTAGPGAPVPAHPRLQLLNRSKLPKGLVAVSLVGRLRGKRHGLDVFITLIRERLGRTVTVTTDDLPGEDAAFGIVAAATAFAPGKNLAAGYMLLRKFYYGSEPINAVDAPSGGQTLNQLFEQPQHVVQILDGPATVDRNPLMNDDIKLVELLATREPDSSLLKETLEKIEALIHNDLNGDGRIGPPPTKPPPPPPPRLYKYSFNSLALSFDVDTLLVEHHTMSFSGTVCGDPLSTPWSITAQSDANAPFTQQITFTAGTPAPIVSLVTSVGNPAVQVAKVTAKLTFTPGTTVTMTLAADQSGSVSNLTINPARAAVTATPVSSCP